MLAKLGQVAYTRDFGLKKGQLLPPHDGSKMTVPDSVIVHVSWKGPMAQLSAWLDELRRPIWLTRRHEPHGDIAPAALRAECAEMTEVVDGHPNRDLVLGHGPIVTRYWLTKSDSDPADWWYDGATFFGVDAYNGQDMTHYRSAEEMFGAAAAFARRLGVPWMVPELGAERIDADTSGTGRAAAIRAWITWLRAQPDCLAAGWWWHGGDLPAPGSPEETAIIEAMEESAMARMVDERWWREETIPPSLAELGERLRAHYGLPAANIGVKGNTAHPRGYHRSRAWVKNSAFCTNRSYSVTETAGNRSGGDSRWCCALDVKLPTAELIAACKRLDAAVRAGRLEKITEWYGNDDGDNRVDGYNNIENRVATSDDSHLWHLHMSFDRGRANEDHGDVFAILTGAEGIESMLCKKGDTGENVVALQVMLSTSGFSPGPIDGKYGDATAAALLAARQSLGLTVRDGGANYDGWAYEQLHRIHARKHAGTATQGPAGPAGPQGPKGDQGPAGPKGDAAVLPAGATLIVQP